MTSLVEQLEGIVGAGGCTTDPMELQPYLTEWRGTYVGRTAALVKPRSTGEVSAIVKACSKAGVAIVPQGGNTGMCGGAVPDDVGDQVVLSLERMSQILDVDAENFSMVVEAGCILERAQDVARQNGRYLPLSLGAEGSCQVGGNISTNAGGMNVGRYGTARALVLGLEIVLADGTIVDGIRSLRKDTAGYDLKQLFIGSEGTLGIITAASLRLFPDPGQLSTALLGIESAAVAVDLFGDLRRTLDDRIESFELVSEYVFSLVTKHVPRTRLPFDQSLPWYVLLESATGDSAAQLENALVDAAERGQLLDAVIAKNAQEAADFWRLRHSISEAERHEGKGLKHDISVPLSKMQAFLQGGDELLAAGWPNAKLVAFGHIGDGNLHYNVVLPTEFSDSECRDEGERISRAIYDLVQECEGSFSAEHGIGQSKREWLERYRGGPELDLMRKLKNTLDPANLLNPGKVI